PHARARGALGRSAGRDPRGDRVHRGEGDQYKGYRDPAGQGGRGRHPASRLCHRRRLGAGPGGARAAGFPGAPQGRGVASDLEKQLVVAIDGPAGAGKSTVARQVAEALGYLYIDTGAMYRALTLAVLRAGVAVDDAAAVAAVVDTARVDLEPGPRGNRVLLNGEDVTAAIRLPEVSAAVSQVAAGPAVRERLVALQRHLAQGGGVVMDGRDIGTVVLPQADVKV